MLLNGLHLIPDTLDTAWIDDDRQDNRQDIGKR